MHRNTGLEFLLALNQEHSKLFIDSAPQRRLYREEHPTEVGVIQCMDGRIHVPTLTKLPLGVSQSWANLGGRFNLGWPNFQQSIADWISYAFERDRDCLLLVTYHFSRGDIHRGCRGYDYNTALAQQETAALVKQFDHDYQQTQVYPILVGIETDTDSLILHGERGEVVDLAACMASNEQSILVMLKNLYHAIPEHVLIDLVPLISGNIEHCQQVQALHRPVIEMDHQESVLAVGRGYEWLHEPNAALIIGPFQPDLTEPIEKAAQILANNVAVGHTDRVVLAACAPFRSNGYRQRLAERKARFLMNFAIEVIKDRVPGLLGSLDYLTGVVNVETRLLQVTTICNG